MGLTSLYDAISKAARTLADRPSPRRAVVVLTDGTDTSSRLTPSQVSTLASAIDVPVYVIAVLSPLDHPGTPLAVPSARPSPMATDLATLAYWTGGDLIMTSAPAHASVAASAHRHPAATPVSAGVRGERAARMASNISDPPGTPHRAGPCRLHRRRVRRGLVIGAAGAHAGVTCQTVSLSPAQSLSRSVVQSLIQTRIEDDLDPLCAPQIGEHALPCGERHHLRNERLELDPARVDERQGSPPGAGRRGEP